LKAIKKDDSKPAAEAAGTSIAICLVSKASGENRERDRHGLYDVLISAANILLASFIYVIVRWIWQG
jgi:hypothetical protein